MKKLEARKTKIIKVDGAVTTDEDIDLCEIECRITNDEKGKTLSLRAGNQQFSIPFEPIEEYLK